MITAALVSSYYAAKYKRMAINPAKDYERYCRVAAVEDDIKRILDNGVDMEAIPWWIAIIIIFMNGGRWDDCKR